MMQRIHAVFRGRVQGVSFRYFVYRNGQRLSLSGWVRNRPDGSVELVAEGPRERLEELIDVSKVGPPLARVEAVETDWQEAKGEFSEFDIQY